MKTVYVHTRWLHVLVQIKFSLHGEYSSGLDPRVSRRSPESRAQGLILWFHGDRPSQDWPSCFTAIAVEYSPGLDPLVSRRSPESTAHGLTLWFHGDRPIVQPRAWPSGFTAIAGEYSPGLDPRVSRQSADSTAEVLTVEFYDDRRRAGADLSMRTRRMCARVHAHFL